MVKIDTSEQLHQCAVESGRNELVFGGLARPRTHENSKPADLLYVRWFVWL